MTSVTSTVEEQTRAAEEKFLKLFVRGPERRTWSTLPPQVGDAAPDLRLLDTTGVDVSLSRSWSDRPALLIFWRHYGCGCGADRAKRLRAEYDDYVDAGATVVVIGQAEPERTAAYAAREDFRWLVLCDPDYEAYGAYGLTECEPAQLLFDAPPEYWAHSREIGEQFVSARREAGRPLVDNPWLLPGEFVVGKNGTIRLAYRYQYCEDFPDPRVLTTAIRMATERA
jgi:peroxiredoxin